MGRRRITREHFWLCCHAKFFWGRPFPTVNPKYVWQVAGRKQVHLVSHNRMDVLLTKNNNNCLGVLPWHCVTTSSPFSLPAPPPIPIAAQSNASGQKTRNFTEGGHPHFSLQTLALPPTSRRMCLLKPWEAPRCTWPRRSSVSASTMPKWTCGL